MFNRERWLVLFSRETPSGFGGPSSKICSQSFQGFLGLNYELAGQSYNLVVPKQRKLLEDAFDFSKIGISSPSMCHSLCRSFVYNFDTFLPTFGEDLMDTVKCSFVFKFV